MLLWITLVIFPITLFIAIKYWDECELPEAIQWIDIITCIATGLASIIMVIIICSNWIGVDADVAESHVLQESLRIRYEQAQWPNRESIAKEIENWNRNLSWKQVAQDDFWLDPFIPDVYDQFDLIDISKNGGREK